MSNSDADTESKIRKNDPDSDTATQASLTVDIRELIRDVDTLRQQHETEIQPQLTALADRADTIETVIAEFVGEVDTIQHRTAELTDSISDIEAEMQRLEDNINAFNKQYATFRDSIQSDLDTIEAVLEQFSHSIDELETKTTKQTSQLNKIEEYVKQQQRLTAISQTAAQRSISTATCGSCGETINVGLLTRPLCPHCEAAYSDLSVSSGLLRTRATLHVVSDTTETEKSQQTDE